MGGDRRRPRDGYQNVDFERDEPGSIAREPIVDFASEPVLEHDGFSIDVTEIAEAPLRKHAPKLLLWPEGALRGPIRTSRAAVGRR